MTRQFPELIIDEPTVHVDHLPETAYVYDVHRLQPGRYPAQPTRLGRPCPPDIVPDRITYTVKSVAEKTGGEAPASCTLVFYPFEVIPGQPFRGPGRIS